MSSAISAFNSDRTSVGVGSFVGMMVSVAPILIAPFPVLLQPVSETFRWGRSTMSLAFLLATSTATVLYPLVGRALDRWGSRAILMPGFVMFGLAICGLALISESKPELFALYVLAGALSTLPTGVAFGRAISRVFDSNRGLAFGVCLGVGGGIGSAVIPIYTHCLIESFGWRAAYVGLGLGPLAIGFPAALLFVREPAPKSAECSSTLFGLTLPEAIRTSTFPIVLAGIFILNLVVGGLLGHFVAIASDAHVGAGKAAAMVGVASFATMMGQLVVGVALDRVKSPKLALPTFILVLLGAVLIQNATSAASLFVGVVLVGFGAGSEYGLLPYFLTRLFGLRSFGQIYGVVYGASAVSYGLGTYVMGWTFDHQHSYFAAYVSFESALIVGLGLLATLRRYVYSTNGDLIRGAAN